MKRLVKVFEILSIPFKNLKRITKVKQKGFRVFYELEGDFEFRLPKVGPLDILSKLGRDKIFKSSLMLEGSTKEPLLRKIVYELFQIDYLDRKKSIIDIGCYIGDNSLVWSRMLESGSVYAIDGSPHSLRFALEMGKLNNIDNIRFKEAVCADTEQIPLAVGGSQSGTFFDKTDSQAAFFSTTIDRVIPEDDHEAISLFHIDVEGFEEKVIAGAENVIKNSRPVIIFEQHLAVEDPLKIIQKLRQLEYSTFMINEVLPENRLDCRNFIAFDARRPLPEISHLIDSDGAKELVFLAIPGPPIIEVKL